MHGLIICALLPNEIAAAVWTIIPDRGRLTRIRRKPRSLRKKQCKRDRCWRFESRSATPTGASKMSQILPAAINFFRDCGETRNGSVPLDLFRAWYESDKLCVTGSFGIGPWALLGLDCSGCKPIGSTKEGSGRPASPILTRASCLTLHRQAPGPPRIR